MTGAISRLACHGRPRPSATRALIQHGVGPGGRARVGSDGRVEGRSRDLGQELERRHGERHEQRELDQRHQVGWFGRSEPERTANVAPSAGVRPVDGGRPDSAPPRVSNCAPVIALWSVVLGAWPTTRMDGSGSTNGSGPPASSRPERSPRRRSRAARSRSTVTVPSGPGRSRMGDEIRIRLGPYEHTVAVRALSDRRGPASEASGLYEETEASRKKREAMARAAQDTARRVRAGQRTADQEGPAGDRQTAGKAVAVKLMFSTIASPNSDVLSSVAPGIRRSKS